MYYVYCWNKYDIIITINKSTFYSVHQNMKEHNIFTFQVVWYIFTKFSSRLSLHFTYLLSLTNVPCKIMCFLKNFFFDRIFQCPFSGSVTFFFFSPIDFLSLQIVDTLEKDVPSFFTFAVLLYIQYTVHTFCKLCYSSSVPIKMIRSIVLLIN